MVNKFKFIDVPILKALAMKLTQTALSYRVTRIVILHSTVTFKNFGHSENL